MNVRIPRWDAAIGKAPSRAALVAVAVARQMRRQAAEQDAQVLREHAPADDLQARRQRAGAPVRSVLHYRDDKPVDEADTIETMRELD